jgi:hypothetical protein
MLPQFRHALPHPDPCGLKACPAGFLSVSLVEPAEQRGKRCLSGYLQGKADRKGKVSRIFRAETHQNLQGLLSRQYKGGPPVLRQRKEAWGKDIRRQTARRTGKQINEKIKALPPGSSLINTDKGS